MRVLMFSLDPKMADPESSVRLRHREYAVEMEELAVIVLAPNDKQETIQEGALTLYFSGRRLHWKLWYWISGIMWGVRKGREVAKQLKRKGDVVATSHEPFGVGLITYLVARPLGIPLQLQLHTDIFAPYFRASFKNKLFLILAHFLFPRAQGIRVVSERMKKLLPTAYCLLPERITVLPVFVDVSKFQGAPPFSLKERYPQFKKIVLVVSRLAPEKKVARAISVFAKLHDYHPDTGMIILGEGSECEALKLKAKSYNLEAAVIFAGYQNDLVSYYKGTDVLLVTSEYEGYGMQIIEALASGCPVVSTDVGIAREAGAIIADLADDLARALESVLTSGKQGILAPQFMVSKQEYLRQLQESWQKIVQ